MGWMRSVVAVSVMLGFAMPVSAAQQARFDPEPAPAATAPATATVPAMPAWTPPPIEGPLDTVLTSRGDRVTGRLTGIDDQGVATLVAPHYRSPIRLRLTYLTRVAFPEKKAPTDGQYVLTITNGDRITGKLVDVTPGAIVMQTRAAGKLTVARRVVRTMRATRGGGGLLADRFQDGKMAPWRAGRGGWNVVDGALVLTQPRHDAFVVASLEQAEAVTLVAEVEPMDGPHMDCRIALFASDDNHYTGRNSIYAFIRGSHYYIGSAMNHSQQMVQRGRVNPAFRSGSIRVAYDPEEDRVTLWLDGRKVGQGKVPMGRDKGRFVMFSSRRAIRVKSLQVLPGIVPPASSEMAAGTARSDQVYFVNKDHVGGQALTIDDGRLLIQTEYGLMPVPIERIARIHFRAGDLERPRRVKGDVHVTAGGCRLTVQFRGLTPEAMQASCAYLADPVRLARSALREIKFRIYKK